jgi:hypothetical protein
VKYWSNSLSGAESPSKLTTAWKASESDYFQFPGENFVLMKLIQKYFSQESSQKMKCGSITGIWKQNRLHAM